MMMAEAPSVKTTCPYCGVGCGVIADVAPDGAVAVRGDPDHPANFGRLCSKGSALAETLGLDGRLLHPEIGGARAGWDEALDLTATTFSRAIAEHGPDSVAFYVSGQLLTEDYYVANKLMKGFIGSANIDTNSRLCMASAVAGHRRAFGTDTVPGAYEDLELADLVVLVGSNLAWCHPVLYQRLAAAKEARPAMRVVLVDPRRTMTADIADLHLPIRADGDVALFAGLLAFLAGHEALDRAYVAAHTTGFDAALAAAHKLSLGDVAAQTGLAPEDLATFYDLFAVTEKVVTVFSQGVNQSSSGTDKANAIINCHLATGRIGRPGMGPFSITGQPNAMGGREVGGLANMLAAHMDIERPEHRDLVQRFWHAPVIADKPGLKAVEMFRAVADGRIKALWIMATNPVDSMPEAGLVEEALKACPFVVVSDIYDATDTIRHAHVKLPAAGWGEKDGTVTNSERRISRQRPFLPLPGEARPDWWIITEVARRMGFAEAFPYTSPVEIFAEHAALSASDNDGSRDFDIGAYAGLDQRAFDSLAPFQWPAPLPSPAAHPPFGFSFEVPPAPVPPLPSPLRGGSARSAGVGVMDEDERRTPPPPRSASRIDPPHKGEGQDPRAPSVTRGENDVTVSSTIRFFADGRFFTPDRKARFVAVTPQAETRTSADYPLVLNTGRIRDHWHTMTRTGRSPRLSQHLAEPFVEIHPDDAAHYGIGDAEIVRVTGATGSVLLRALLSDRQARGAIFVPMHWTDQFAAQARVDRLVPGITDPVSGQPALKHVPVRIERFAAVLYGFAVLRERSAVIDADYWALARCNGGWRFEFALADKDRDGAALAAELFGHPPDVLAYHDARVGQQRFAAFEGGRLRGALFLAAEPVAVSRAWAVDQLVGDFADQRARLSVVAGRPGRGLDRGATVCACFGIGANQIAAAVAAGCTTVAAIGEALQAGTNCGSCRSEIRGIIDVHRLRAAE
ncbi:molybdopterin-dependent oxidoreductase [Chelatococcus sp. GCM10030263]|uniref:nitrate reductase n=1 Tax=Chelatococcus sp. GCM10030263 TaxID=3273387 RepID=UPI003612024F